MAELDTLLKFFVDHVKGENANTVAVRQKDFGIWQEFTWQDSYNNVRDFALGLVRLGLQHGERVSIVGDNDREYLWADLAIMAAGGVAVGIFTDSAPNEMEYVITHSDAVLALAKDQEQVDKMLEIKDKTPNVKKVIYWDTRGMWSYDDEWLMSFEDVQELGRKFHAEQPDYFEKMVAEGKADDLCNFCYTSGTTGLPKGAMLSHANFIASARSYEDAEPRYAGDNLLSFAPLAWIAEHTLALTPHVMYGVVINFAESPETVQENLREIAPHVIFYPARLWENLTALIQIRMTDSSWVNRKLYELFLPIGYKVADLRYEKKSIPIWLRALNKMGDLLVFAPLRDKYGFVRVRSAITAGAALSPDMLRFFSALGLNLKQVFGATETTAAGTQHYEDDIRFATVGLPHKGVKIKIVDDEIWVGGAVIFQGYFKNEEETNKSISVSEDGTRWFHTGDAGYLDEDGHLVYLDRVKDMIELSNEERFSPQFIEGRLKFSPYIRDAMTVGSSDVGYVTAMISIDFENVGRWTEKQGIAYTTYVDLSQKPEVYELIRDDIDRVNKTLPLGARVQKFVLMHKEFDADEAEMTRTRKLRRRFLAGRYKNIIGAMYDGASEVKVSAPITYQDGRTGTIDTTVRIAALTAEGAPA